MHATTSTGPGKPKGHDFDLRGDCSLCRPYAIQLMPKRSPRRIGSVPRILASWKTPILLTTLWLGTWAVYEGGLFGRATPPAPAPPPAAPAPFDDES